MTKEGLDIKVWTNVFLGSLAGLRIAPPEAPVSGYMFGKGVYFADMVSKSANYCCTSPRDPIGVLLLCEVNTCKPCEALISTRVYLIHSFN
jgi:poly [ADP-ribose] polymerase